MRIAVLGAGAWGTAIASHAAAAGNSVLLWARASSNQAATVASVCQHHENPRYLPGCVLHPALGTTSSLNAALGHAELLLVATPVAGLRSALAAISAFQAANQPGQSAAVVWLCKGFEATTQQLPHAIAEQLLDHCHYAALSGPSFAREVALGLPVALTVAGPCGQTQQTVVSALHHGAMRIYTSGDIVGVEVGGAVKNVLAIATGIADGLNLGMNARAALITRALVEMTRLCCALGGQAETIMGLSGLGDLVLTATGDLSRNRKVGLQLAQGKALSQVLAELGHVAEGVHCAQSTLLLAQRCEVDMPITRAVCSVLDGSVSPANAVSALLSRQAKAEL